MSDVKELKEVIDGGTLMSDIVLRAEEIRAISVICEEYCMHTCMQEASERGFNVFSAISAIRRLAEPLYETAYDFDEHYGHFSKKSAKNE